MDRRTFIRAVRGERSWAAWRSPPRYSRPQPRDDRVRLGTAACQAAESRNSVPRAPTAHMCAANIQASALPCFKAAMPELGFVDVKSCFASNVAAVILFGKLHGSPYGRNVIMKGVRI